MVRRTIVMLLFGTALPFLVGGATLTYFLAQRQSHRSAAGGENHTVKSEPSSTTSMDASDRGAPPPVAFGGASTPAPATAPVQLHVAPKELAPVEHRLREDTRRFRQQRSQGLLTAGVIDDVIQWERYLAYLQETMRQDPFELLPRAGLGRRLFVQVVDQQQRPIPNALVTLRSANERLLSHRTAADGMVQYISGYDGSALAREVIVETPHETVTKRIEDDATVVVTMQETQGEMPQALDLALVIDTTGSMGDELSYLQREIRNITSQVSEMFPNVEQRFALVVYRDNGDEYVMRSYDFTSDIQTFQSHLNQQRASGGGDTPEAMNVAMQRALTLDWRVGKAARMVFVVGDAPPHDPDLAATLATSTPCREKAIRIYPVAASGVRDKAEYLLRSMAALTGGQYLFLTDHSGIGNAHHDPHVGQYAVESLEQAMLRMVSSELTGKRLGPDEIVAIESGKLHYDQINHDDYIHVVYHPPQMPEPQTQTQTQTQSYATASHPVTPPTPHVYVGSIQAPSPWQSFWSRVDRMAMPFALFNFGVGAVFLGVCLWQTQRRLQGVQPGVFGDPGDPADPHSAQTPSAGISIPSAPRKPPQL